MTTFRKVNIEVLEYIKYFQWGVAKQRIITFLYLLSSFRWKMIFQDEYPDEGVACWAATVFSFCSIVGSVRHPVAHHHWVNECSETLQMLPQSQKNLNSQQTDKCVISEFQLILN